VSAVYLEFQFLTGKDRQTKDILISGLSDIGFESFMDDETGFLGYVQETEFNQGTFDELISTFKHPINFKQNRIEPQNWNAVWEAQFDPIRINEHCVIRAPFHPAFEDGSIELIIEPKMSFGTGHHATTRLMSKALMKMPVAGKKVMDMGCGTGVLGILAAKLQAAEVKGIDIEEWAVENAIENAGRNEVEMQISLGGAELLIESEEYDIFLANINRNILMQDMDFYIQSMKKGASLLLSGFLEPDVSAITETCKTKGLKFSEELAEDTWRCLIFLK
jgi:ribosomal protein L11 methyltransferase